MYIGEERYITFIKWSYLAYNKENVTQISCSLWLISLIVILVFCRIYSLYVYKTTQPLFFLATKICVYIFTVSNMYICWELFELNRGMSVVTLWYYFILILFHFCCCFCLNYRTCEYSITHSIQYMQSFVMLNFAFKRGFVFFFFLSFSPC